MSQTYIGAIDQGTTGTRFMVFDHDGRVVANAYGRHEQIYPQPGWVEHDPIEIWETVESVTTRALASAGLDPEALDAVGVANQRETTVVWDAASGNPVYNAISWQDRRTVDRMEALDDATVARLRERTGLEPDAYFSASKIEWILDNADPLKLRRTQPRGVRERAADGDLCVGTVDSWLVYNLTGEHVTDVTNASRTLLYDIHEGAWDDALLEEFRVPEATLPEVSPSSDAQAYGTTDPDSVFGAAVPVTAALGDQQAALFGQTCFDDGDAKNTYGTGAFYLANTGTEPVRSDHGLLTTVAYQLAGEPVQYALEGSTFVTGAAVEWLQTVGFVDDPAETAELARSVDATNGVYVVPAFTGLGAPHWDGRARGTILGITRGTGKEHVVRATLEAIAHHARDVAEAMAADTGAGTELLRVDGGVAKNDFLCQLQADILQADLVRPVVDETTALGAAYAAGLAVGYWDSVDDLRANWQVDRRFHPELDASEADRRHERWGEAVDRARGWDREG